MVNKKIFYSIVCLFCLLAVVQLVTAYGAESVNKNPNWTLVWSDEFDGPNGSPPDPQKWSYDIGAGGWGNEELEYYTDSTKNSFQENGNLIIRALEEKYKGSRYTSARLVTKAKFEQTYGKFEARIKIPGGKGVWPAFWLLGSDYDPAKKNWPQCGEIDIMENIGTEPSIVHASMHGPGYSDETAFTKKYTLPGDQKFLSDYHVFAVEWEPNEVRYYVDGNNYYTVKKAEVLSKGEWVFDKPFYIILNVAVGGDWPGSPEETAFPQNLYVDYVRVYKR